MKKNYRVVITQITYRGTHEPLVKKHTLSWHRFWIGAWWAKMNYEEDNKEVQNPPVVRVNIYKLFNQKEDYTGN